MAASHGEIFFLVLGALAPKMSSGCECLMWFCLTCDIRLRSRVHLLHQISGWLSFDTNSFTMASSSTSECKLKNACFTPWQKRCVWSPLYTKRKPFFLDANSRVGRKLWNFWSLNPVGFKWLKRCANKHFPILMIEATMGFHRKPLNEWRGFSSGRFFASRSWVAAKTATSERVIMGSIEWLEL